MSLTDAVTSTVSTIINSILIVVNEATINSSSSGDSRRDFDATIVSDSMNYNSLMNRSNATTVLPSLHTVSATPSRSEGVADGVSTGQQIAVITLLIVFSIFGCLGNGLVLYVFTKKSDKVTSTTFILALAWTDFVTCLVILPFTVASIILNSTLVYDFVCKLYQFLITSNVPLSAFIMVAIALDRYFSICHPFLHVITPKRARIAILVLVAFTFVVGSIAACCYGVYKYDNVKESVALGEASWCRNDTLDITFGDHARNATGSHAQNAASGSPHVESSTPIYNNIVEILISNVSFSSLALNSTENVEYGPHPTDAPGCTRMVRKIVYGNGMCAPNEIIFSDAFATVYQKIHISFYIISLVSVFTLYFFIYRSVVKRRAWRRKQKSWSHSPMTMTAAVTAVDNGNKVEKTYNLDADGGVEHLELTPKGSFMEASRPDGKENGGGISVHDATTDTTGSSLSHNVTAKSPVFTVAKTGGHENGAETSTLSASAEKKTSRERRDFNFLANIRTAIMLFVVALVFIISFLPACLMATQLISYQIVVFYMHYMYNVANPVIYAFMNQSFRKELKRVFQRDCRLNCCERTYHPYSDRGVSRTGMTAMSICDSPDETKAYSPIYKSPSQES